MLTLYVARDRRDARRHDTGSVLCINLCDALRTVDVQIVECPLARHPHWLVGTPTLHSHESNDVWRGHEAVAHLQHLALQEAEARGAERARTKKRDSSSKSSVLTPTMHLRPEESRSPSNEAAHTSVGSDLPSIEESIWESRIADDDGDDEASGVGVRKLSQDDLQSALQRTRPPPAHPSTSETVPSITPLKD